MPRSPPDLRPRSAGDLGHDPPDVLRLDYAVDLMVVLRCTQRLLLRLKQRGDAPAAQSTTRLGDWYGNLLYMGRRQALIFISERSRLPVLLPARQADRLRSMFPDAVCDILTAVGVPAEAIERERLEMSEIVFARTNSRSLLSSLTDFSLAVRAHVAMAPDEPLERIARDLTETPIIVPFGGAAPDGVTRRIFESE